MLTLTPMVFGRCDERECGGEGAEVRPAPGVAAVAAERSRRLREGLWTVRAARAPAGPRGGLFDARRARRRVLPRGRLPGPGRRRVLHAGARERAAGPHAARRGEPGGAARRGPFGRRHGGDGSKMRQGRRVGPGVPGLRLRPVQGRHKGRLRGPGRDVRARVNTCPTWFRVPPPRARRSRPARRSGRGAGRASDIGGAPTCGASRRRACRGPRRPRPAPGRGPAGRRRGPA